MYVGPPRLHPAQKRGLDWDFFFLSPGDLVLIQAKPLWGGSSRNVMVIRILSLIRIQIISRLGLQFLQVKRGKEYVIVSFQQRMQSDPCPYSLGTELSINLSTGKLFPRSVNESLSFKSERNGRILATRIWKGHSVGLAQFYMNAS